jgi:flagella basal body P-ring formation protein FlgA
MISFCTMLCLALAATPTQPSDPPTKIEIRCRSDAMIRGVSILLRDLADISAADAALAGRVGEIRLAHRPSFGFNRVFTQADIRQALVQAGLGLEGVTLSGASETVAQPLSTLLRPQDLREAADGVLRAAIALEPNADIEFEVLNSLQPMQVPPGRLDLALRARVRDGSLGATGALVDVDFVVDGEVYKTMPLSYRLRRFVDAWVVARAVRRGQPLTHAELEQKRLEAAPGTELYITSFEQIDGMVASRNLQNGKPLSIVDLARPAAVFHNDPVHLVSRRGRVLVTARAIALQDAPIGGRIQVRNLSTGAVVQAVVQEPGIVVLPAK